MMVHDDIARNQRTQAKVNAKNAHAFKVEKTGVMIDTSWRYCVQVPDLFLVFFLKKIKLEMAASDWCMNRRNQEIS
jgi:fibrillarin-like rRNA methylase